MSTIKARRARTGAVRLLFSIAFGMSAASPAHAQLPSLDPLPSWNDGMAKQAIFSFVRAVTTERSPDFVPVEDRIAVFDIEGTLLMERPLPTEVYFALRRVGELVRADSSLRWKQPFRAALDGDTAFFREGGGRAIADLLTRTHAGATQQEFTDQVRAFLESERHPVFQRRFTEMTYTPMLELLAYLRASGFQTWASAGGTTDFARVCAAKLYGIPAERIFGTEIRTESRSTDAGPVLVRLPEVARLNDREGKVAGIEANIGKRPLFVAGNVSSGGDLAMMQYSKASGRKSLQLLLNHDDERREYSYGESDGASLAAARATGYTVVSMRSDWNRIFNWRSPTPLTQSTAQPSVAAGPAQ